ncbi:MAG: hypothetical protein H8Z69_00260 [Nanohaloarchaea archaeon]|nr:hypothetical protein [Candidatus Nanohaloarchaea archaeon]
MEWNDPSSDGDFDSDVFLSVDPSSDSNVHNVTLYVQGPDQDSFAYTDEMTQGDGTNNYTTTLGKDQLSGTHGDYDVKAAVYNASDETAPETETDTLTLTLDGKSPSINIEGGDYVADDPTISIELSDEHTGVDSFSVDATDDASIEDNGDFDSCDADETCTVEVQVDTSDLDSGDSFDLDADATDDVGNQGSSSKTFDFDTEYNGDTSPSFDPEEGNILLTDDDEETLEITLDGQGDDAEESDITVTCYDGSDDEFDSETQDVDEEDSTTFDCDVEGDEYAGSTEDIYVEMCDEADNCEESETRTYNFDANPPVLTDVEAASEVNSFNSDFDVNFEVADDASGVESLEYYFDSSTDEGDGTSIDYSDDSSSFEVDTSGLSEGDHTLYLRAKDNAERWSEPETIDFNFYPNADPKVSLSSDSSIEVAAGSSKTLIATLENTGKFYIGSLDFSASSPVFSDSQTISDFGKGDTANLELEINPAEQDIGSYDLQLSTSNPSSSKTVNLRVKASEDQRSSIESEFQSQLSKYERLKSNITSLRTKVGQQKTQNLNANFSALNESINNAQTAMDNGEYYKVESELSSLNDEYSKASQTYQTVKEHYDSSRTAMMFIALFGIVVIGGLGAGAFLIYSDDFDVGIEPEDLKQIGSDVDMDSVDEVKQKVESKVEDLTDSNGSGAKSEEGEFEWDGFKDA